MRELEHVAADGDEGGAVAVGHELVAGEARLGLEEGQQLVEGRLQREARSLVPLRPDELQQPLHEGCRRRTSCSMTPARSIAASASPFATRTLRTSRLMTMALSGFLISWARSSARRLTSSKRFARSCFFGDALSSDSTSIPVCGHCQRPIHAGSIPVRAGRQPPPQTTAPVGGLQHVGGGGLRAGRAHRASGSGRCRRTSWWRRSRPPPSSASVPASSRTPKPARARARGARCGSRRPARRHRGTA
jgi:hypothetical protein